jgi:hypothetical protein
MGSHAEKELLENPAPPGAYGSTTSTGIVNRWINSKTTAPDSLSPTEWMVAHMEAQIAHLIL